MISREADDNLRKQESSSTSDNRISRAIRPSSSLAAGSSSSWSRLRDDPRVVRVSKAFGGKDRHSKVRTVRGLRDRRVRLTVPTAIQLYDLQDRLGLNQPSKVVDWLIDAAKHEIDELPPLQIPPGSSFHQIMASQVDQYSLKLSGSTTTNWNNNDSRPKDGSGGDMDWDRDDEEERHTDHFTMDGHNFLSRNLHLSGLTSNNSIPYGRYEPNSGLSLSHPPRSYESTATEIQDDRHNLIISPEPVARSHFVYQHGMSTESYFPLQIAAMNSKVSSSAAASSSSTQQVRPIHCMNSTATLFPSQNPDDDLYEQKTRETYNHFR